LRISTLKVCKPDERPKRQTVSFRTVVGLHGGHTTHDQNAFVVKACETFQIPGVNGLAQPGVEKNSSPFRRGTFNEKPKHRQYPVFTGDCAPELEYG
jgi:hypothetical protein